MCGSISSIRRRIAFRLAPCSIILATSHTNTAVPENRVLLSITRIEKGPGTPASARTFWYCLRIENEALVALSKIRLRLPDTVMQNTRS